MAHESLYRLTKKDLELHKRALIKMRGRLFESRPREKCYIVGDERVLPPSVDVRIDLDTGKPIRHVALGGLEYTLKFPMAKAGHRISVEHWAGANFSLHASFTDPAKSAPYTRFSLTVSFSKLPSTFVECIDEMEVESRPLPPLRNNSLRGAD